MTRFESQKHVEKLIFYFRFHYITIFIWIVVFIVTFPTIYFTKPVEVGPSLTYMCKQTWLDINRQECTELMLEIKKMSRNYSCPESNLMCGKRATTLTQDVYWVFVLGMMIKLLTLFYSVNFLNLLRMFYIKNGSIII